MGSSTTDIDSPDRFTEIRRAIESKPALKMWYEEIYCSYRGCLEKCPKDGIAIELGAGAGLVKSYLPEILATDVISYPGIDRIIDATKMDFGDSSLRAIFLMNVLHHIPDAEAFFSEAQRCLKPGGRAFIVDQYPGFLSRFILKYAHSEPFDEKSLTWQFPSTGPLSGANGALAWIVFFRDRKIFEQKFPHLEILRIIPHSPLRYWLSGGLKTWTLIPGFLFPLMTWIDYTLAKVWPHTSSFMSIEIKKSNAA